ncbi:hypothetical protein ACFQH8_09925 [Halomicroarcula sp. GCM10025710]
MFLLQRLTERRDCLRERLALLVLVGRGRPENLSFVGVELGPLDEVGLRDGRPEPLAVGRHLGRRDGEPVLGSGGSLSGLDSPVPVLPVDPELVRHRREPRAVEAVGVRDRPLASRKPLGRSSPRWSHSDS